MVGLDFGATYSGFAYCHVAGFIETNELWHRGVSSLKTNTILQYDGYNVKSWGSPALVSGGNKPVELFKLHLSDLPDNFKPKLSVDYKKAITDYFIEIGKVRVQNIINL